MGWSPQVREAVNHVDPIPFREIAAILGETSTGEGNCLIAAGIQEIICSVDAIEGYSGLKYQPESVLKGGEGNCVDISVLCASMMKAAEISARITAFDQGRSRNREIRCRKERC